ncbi:hypothetical protein SEA_SKOG_225 [Gordonia phage Skog]|uniref:Uncharacterized protein n=1 Tax=Gordonia phage Skog TaxID=2704033 RepID=A0A6G6XJY7_9CAUD|nr:hypothetical protein KHQ85_gp225 [Gordonia phage Skog]QIG58377.1 hypothetical protein SEA_SKOG_225 [Gordonia phage Skog]
MAADKVESSVTDAMGRKEMAFDVGSVNGCVLCGKEFGEASPRRGVMVHGQVAIVHNHCADRHEYGTPPAQASDPEPSKGRPGSAFAGKRIAFRDLLAFQAFVLERGPFLASTEVSINGMVVQKGDL